MKHLCFIGRWVTFHDGHKYIMKKKHDEKKLPLLILIRNKMKTSYVRTRHSNIKDWLVEENIKGEVMVMPDIEGVYYGRGVGYNVEEIKVPDNIRKISGTKIRSKNEN